MSQNNGTLAETNPDNSDIKNIDNNTISVENLPSNWTTKDIENIQILLQNLTQVQMQYAKEKQSALMNKKREPFAENLKFQTTQHAERLFNYLEQNNRIFDVLNKIQEDTKKEGDLNKILAVFYQQYSQRHKKPLVELNDIYKSKIPQNQENQQIDLESLNIDEKIKNYKQQLGFEESKNSIQKIELKNNKLEGRVRLLYGLPIDINLTAKGKITDSDLKPLYNLLYPYGDAGDYYTAKHINIGVQDKNIEETKDLLSYLDKISSENRHIESLAFSTNNLSSKNLVNFLNDDKVASVLATKKHIQLDIQLPKEDTDKIILLTDIFTSKSFEAHIAHLGNNDTNKMMEKYQTMIANMPNVENNIKQAVITQINNHLQSWTPAEIEHLVDVDTQEEKTVMLSE